MFSRTCDVMYGTSVFYFHFVINSARPGFWKNSVVFFSSFASGLLFFFVLLFRLRVRFLPQHQIFQQKGLYSSYQAFLISSCNLTFLVVRIACCFTRFSPLKLRRALMAPKIKTMHKVLIFVDCRGAGQVWQINLSKQITSGVNIIKLLHQV